LRTAQACEGAVEPVLHHAAVATTDGHHVLKTTADLAEMTTGTHTGHAMTETIGDRVVAVEVALVKLSAVANRVMIREVHHPRNVTRIGVAIDLAPGLVEAVGPVNALRLYVATIVRVPEAQMA
jgi:hypothetical protein